ncbi:suppressor of cytokine signaling 7-like [Scomber japonicus]|uniref:suppressor of cytokine signaling 7-like n=1 Tax=Scomber japonicus TaxID=13676 RepID=UPI002304D606|nr:suppressor of cytokine signaling 7-like [Scomber japonicus]XP_053195024.1 suppressor of cytokine signaling 7-like [Scomber japonicus]
MNEEPSPDFVLMRLVSAAEYDRLEEPEDRLSGGFGPVKASPSLGSASPHYSSPLPGKGELDGGLLLPEAPLEPRPPPPQHGPGPGGPGSKAQLMVLQNLLRSGDRILECGLEPPPPGERPGPGPGSTTDGPGPGGGKDQNPHCAPPEETLQPSQWHPVVRAQNHPGVPESESGSVLCHRHRVTDRVLTDRVAQWPPALLDQALRLGLLEPRKNRLAGGEDPVLALARRLGQLGEGGGGEDLMAPLPHCSCHSVLASGTGGEDASETSDALLVLEGLGSEEVGGLGEGGDHEKGDRGGGGGSCGGAGTLSGLMRQVHRLAEEAGVCTDQSCRSSLAVLGASVSPSPTSSRTPPPVLYPPDAPPPHQSRSQPQSRATTPKLGVASGGRSASPLVVLEGEVGGEKTPRGKSRKGGSLKVRLSKLFRTKSSSGGPGGGLDKRPSLSSSTSSGGSLLDVWGSSCSNTEPDSARLQVSRPHSAFSPVPFTPAFTDDFGGPPQQQGPFLERSVGASMQSLPPRPLALPPSLSTIQHSLSLNDTFLRGLPRPIPLRPDGQHLPPRLVPRCPLSRPDANSFATSLRELEKCGWYWGPMNWEDAEMKLKGKPDGSFLVRDSSDPRYILSLSFRSQGVTHHTRMEHYRGTFSLWCHPKFEDRCHSVVEFIERAIMHSKNGKFLYFLRSRVPGLPPTPVQLLYPVSRFSSVKSLQHLCRFCIRQLVRIDHIQELPLPTPLISYLRKFYYYDPEEEISPVLKERGAERGAEPSSQPGVESQT